MVKIAGDLPFEYQTRARELAELLSSGDPDKIEQAIELQEQQQRQLENFLKNVGSGGTAQSILWTGEAKHEETFSSRPNLSVTYDDFSIACPDDPAFNYYLDWHISGNTKIDKTLDFEFAGFAQILGNTPGAGFEHWGWINTVAAAPTLSGALPGAGAYQASSGTAARKEFVPSGLRGTSLVLRTQVGGFFSDYTMPYLTTYIAASLIAIPA